MDENNSLLLRVLDANLNRLREALRVLEESERFINNRGDIAAHFKSLRDDIRKITECFNDGELLASRNSECDSGRSSAGEGEMKRATVREIVEANFKRAEESSRVIEEYSKLINGSASKLAKSIRFRLYDFEKEMLAI